MKTLIKSAKGPPLRRVLCSFLFGAAAFCVVPANSQAATIQAPGDIVWVTIGNTIAKYNASGTAINTNFITLQAVPIPLTPAYGIPHLGGILACASGGIGGTDPILYVAAEWVPNLSFGYFVLSSCHCWQSYYINYVIATYDAVTGRSIFTAAHRIGVSWPPRAPQPFGPAGMAVLGTNHGIYYVANYSKGSITQGGNVNFIKTSAPYALAVGGNVLYVTSTSQNSNGNFYISTWNASTGDSINPYFIPIPTGGLYGLALLGNTLYVSAQGGSAPGVYIYNATTAAQLNGPGPFVSVKEPWGIAIGSPPPNGGNPTLYVASYQDSKIYEFDAITGAQLPYSIKVVSGAPMNITVEPAAAVGN